MRDTGAPPDVRDVGRFGTLSRRLRGASGLREAGIGTCPLIGMIDRPLRGYVRTPLWATLTVLRQELASERGIHG
jgi:hypothetical protein